jgi:hypothetical protein
MTELFNPPPDSMLSAHIYSASDVAELPRLVALGRRLGRPLFVGEFGAQNARHDPAAFYTMLRAVKSSGAPLAAVWMFEPDLPMREISGFTWEYRLDDHPYTASYGNSLSFVLRAVASSAQQLLSQALNVVKR